jgi:hypothetical protein
VVSGCHGLEDAHPSAGRCRCAYRARAWAGRGGWARSGQVDARATIGPYRQPQLPVSPRRRVGPPQPPPPCVSSCDDHIILSNPSKPCAVPVRRGDSVGRVRVGGCACICRRGCEATRRSIAECKKAPRIHHRMIWHVAGLCVMRYSLRAASTVQGY